MHFVPEAQALKEAVPSWDPRGGVCKAIQFTSVVPLDPSPYSKTQTVNPLAETSSSQIAAPLRGVGLFTLWPTEAKMLACCPPEKETVKKIRLQANSPGVVVVKFSFAPLKSSARKEEVKHGSIRIVTASLI